MEHHKINRGWIVVLTGFCINLAFGVLYSWSIFAKQLIDTFNWSSKEASLPYTIAIVCFAMTMLPAGYLQDRFGAKRVVTLSGIMTGLGLLSAGYLMTPIGLAVAFGIMSGIGIGLGYASATPIAIKWFSQDKKGLISGIVISGFGLSTLYMAPLANHLLNTIGIQNAFKSLGIAFLIIVTSLAQLLTPPQTNKQSSGVTFRDPNDKTILQTIQTPIFYLLWIIMFCGSLGGLIIIGNLSKIVSMQSGQNFGFILVACTAVFNASGRPISGMISDKIGRFKTLMLIFFLEGIAFFNFGHLNTFVGLLAGAAIVTYCYGSLFSIMPSLTIEYFGKANLGTNYGVLFTSWGIAGILGPMLASAIYDIQQTFTLSYTIAGSLCSIGFALSAIAYISQKKVAPSTAEQES